MEGKTQLPRKEEYVYKDEEEEEYFNASPAR